RRPASTPPPRRDGPAAAPSHVPPPMPRTRAAGTAGGTGPGATTLRAGVGRRLRLPAARRRAAAFPTAAPLRHVPARRTAGRHPVPGPPAARAPAPAPGAGQATATAVATLSAR